MEDGSLFLRKSVRDDEIVRIVAVDGSSGTAHGGWQSLSVDDPLETMNT